MISHSQSTKTRFKTSRIEEIMSSRLFKCVPFRFGVFVRPWEIWNPQSFGYVTKLRRLWYPRGFLVFLSRKGSTPDFFKNIS